MSIMPLYSLCCQIRMQEASWKVMTWKKLLSGGRKKLWEWQVRLLPSLFPAMRSRDSTSVSSQCDRRGIGEDAFKRTPVGVPDALTWRQPDAMIGADRHHVLQMQLLQCTDKITAFSIQAIGQYDLKMKIPLLQFLDEFHCQLRFRLVRLTWLQAGPGFVDLEEQGKGDLIQDAIGIDGHDAILELAQIANVLMGHVIGAVAFLAVTRLIDAQHE